MRGWQWWWEFRYPELGVVTANELHLPVGRPVVLDARGPRRHPQLLGAAARRQARRGARAASTASRSRPSAPGEYWGQCAEFCGVSHANMRLRVIVDEPAAFERWVAAQKAPPPSRRGDAAAGKALYARSACVGCHTIRGVSARRARPRPHALRQPRRRSAPGCGRTRPRTWPRGCRTRRRSSRARRCRTSASPTTRPRRWPPTCSSLK